MYLVYLFKVFLLTKVLINYLMVLPLPTNPYAYDI